jgi:hypothetical protein
MHAGSRGSVKETSGQVLNVIYIEKFTINGPIEQVNNYASVSASCFMQV